MQDREWSWVSEDGIEYQGGLHQLTSELSAERLPAYTLVSRMDWRDWLPAMQVAELQGALPRWLVDAPRQPTTRAAGPKLPPPLSQYPLLRGRALELQRLAAAPATATSSHPPDSIPAFAFRGQDYIEDDFDEPTVQIDAEQLERALSESRVADGTSTPPGASSPPSSPPPRPSQENPILHRMPTFPGYAPQGPASGSPPGRPLSNPGHFSASTQPERRLPFPSHPDAAIPSPLPTAPSSLLFQPDAQAFGGHEPTLASRVDSRPPPAAVEPPFRGPSKVPLLIALAAGAGLGAAWLLAPIRSDSPAPTVPTSTAVAVPSPASTQNVQPLTCRVTQNGQVSDFAHVQVPVQTRAFKPQQLAVGFGQTSRLAVGMVVDPATLGLKRVFSESQSSPLWSVVPVLDGDLSFRTNRAASTLRSTTTIPTRPPLALGLSREGLAVRGPSDVIDRVLWSTTWDTITVPDVWPLSEQTFALVLRAGGERGQVLVGEVSAEGSPRGELVAVAGLEGRLDNPALAVSKDRVFVTVAVGAGAQKTRLHIATSRRPQLPTTAHQVLEVDAGLSSARLTDLSEHRLLLQYTEGATGHQRVMGRVLDEQLRPLSEAFAISPDGRDAYDGTIVNHYDTPLSLFFVRHEQGHELWLSRLNCE